MIPSSIPSSRRVAVLALLPLLALAVAVSAGAEPVRTPDGETPSEETACDGLVGAAFGLCTAYCEAQDCELQADPDTSCRRLRDAFVRLTGVEPPCMTGACSVRAPIGRTYDVQVEINVDDQYCLYADDLLVDCRTDWTTTGTYSFPMESGCHVIAVEGSDVFGLISGFIAVVRVDGGVVSLSGDGTWVHPPSEPPPPGWRDAAFDDSLWIPTVACSDPSPWGGAPAPLLAEGASWVWDDPSGDCYSALGEVYLRLELALP